MVLMLMVGELSWQELGSNKLLPRFACLSVQQTGSCQAGPNQQQRVGVPEHASVRPCYCETGPMSLSRRDCSRRRPYQVQSEKSWPAACCSPFYMHRGAVSCGRVRRFKSLPLP